MQTLQQSKNPQIQDQDSIEQYGLKTDQQAQQPSQPQVQTELTKLKSILQKPHELRSGSDNHFITNFIKQNIGLAQLSQQISMEFVKSLFKTAMIVFAPKGSIICQRGGKIDEMGVVISGQLTVLHNQEDNGDGNTGDAPVISLNNDQMFDNLLQKAKIFGKQLRKKKSIGNLTQTIPKQKAINIQQKSYKLHNSSQLIIAQSYINHNEYFGFKDRSISENYVKTCLCENEETVLLVFKEFNIMVALEIALKQKLKKMTVILREISCFNFLDIDKLNLIIQNMVLRRKKRNQYVYKQGQQAIYFYLLIQGQIKITKQTNLFLQNPNILYGDRKKLVYQSLAGPKKQTDKVQKIFIDRQVKKNMLPYANLTTLYNYRPMKKMMDIGVITPPCLFGQEEYTEKKLRDTNTICNSLSIQYYQIKISKLEEIIGVKMIQNFRNQVRNLVRKKVLYRQSQYANSIHYENNSNMNYFYLQDDKQKQSPRNFKISKFNNIIQSKKQSAQKGSPKQEATFATFTSFNFHKMGSHSKLGKSRKSEQKTQDNQKSFQQNPANPTELKIMEITHTWKPMKDKVDMSQKASRRISPFKPTINLNKPLIASEYFFNMEKQSKRIDRQHRKRIASLSKSFRTSRVSQKQSFFKL